MISRKKLLEELEAWKDRLGVSPPEVAAKIMVKAFIDKVNAQPVLDVTDINVGNKNCGECSRRSWYQKGYEDAGKEINVPSKWIPCSEKMPENTKYKGAFCPKYSVATKYGETIGWYNPDHESWYILIWFMTERFLETEINLEKGDIPKLLKVLNETNIVYAWQPLPEPYKGE